MRTALINTGCWSIPCPNQATDWLLSNQIYFYVTGKCPPFPPLNIRSIPTIESSWGTSWNKQAMLLTRHHSLILRRISTTRFWSISLRHSIVRRLFAVVQQYLSPCRDYCRAWNRRHRWWLLSFFWLHPMTQSIGIHWWALPLPTISRSMSFKRAMSFLINWW